MATIPFQNFALTDPVAAQQAVQMGQILANAQAEKDRQFSSFATETSRQRAASADAERARQARASETDKILASQEKVAGLANQTKAKLSEENDNFNNLSALIETDDPPTDSEFNEMAKNISEENKTVLKRSLEVKRRALNALATEANDLAAYWNTVLKGIDPKDPTALDNFRKRLALDRRATELLSPDPNTLWLRPKYKGPRMDAAAPAAGSTAAGGVQTIGDLQKGIQAQRDKLRGVTGPAAAVPSSPPPTISRSQLLRVSPMVTTAPEAVPQAAQLNSDPFISTDYPPYRPSLSFSPRASDFMSTDIPPTPAPVPQRPIPGPFGTGVPTAPPGIQTDITALLQQPSWFASNVAAPPPPQMQRFPATVTPMESNPAMAQNPVGFAVPQEPETYYNRNPALADFFNFPEIHIPGYVEMNPMQRQEIMRWIAGNPQTNRDQVLAVARELLLRGR